MKRTLLLTATVATVFLASCDKINDALTVHTNYTQTDITFTIPIITAPGSADFSVTNLAINVDSTIKAYNSSLGIANLKSVKIKTCTVSILDNTFFPSDNLTAFDEFGVELKSDNVPSGSTVAILDDTIVDPYLKDLTVAGETNLTEYFKGTLFTYRLYGKANRATGHDMTCMLTITYDLELQP